jgi:Domain of Unknown Function (DUF1080)
MKWCLSPLFALLLAGAIQAQAVPEVEKKEGFLSMFNGKDLTGWRFGNGSALPDKLPDVAKVEDGVIKITGKAPHLGSQWDYEDFDVRFEWRAMDEKYNSGFYIRSGRSVGANQINLAKGGEGGWVPGSNGVKLDGAKTVPALQNKWSEWNAWRVTAVGDKVTFWCNDKLAWEATGFEAKRGYIGLQQEGAKIEFRNLRIKELGYEVLNDAKKWSIDGSGWKIDDGTFTPGDKAMLLSTVKNDYKDYVFRVEYRADKDANGGIGLRGEKATEHFVVVGDLKSGSGAMAHEKPAKKVDYPLGQWNYLELRVKDNKATVWLNGTVVVENADLKGAPDAGSISLQQVGKGLQFRNPRIKEVK